MSQDDLRDVDAQADLPENESLGDDEETQVTEDDDSDLDSDVEGEDEAGDDTEDPRSPELREAQDRRSEIVRKLSAGGLEAPERNALEEELLKLDRRIDGLQ